MPLVPPSELRVERGRRTPKTWRYRAGSARSSPAAAASALPLRDNVRVLANRVIEPMNGNPMVSVVVVFHNTREFLGEAIESVLGQTFGDWELLLVDDGSTDRSDEIARSYAERDERIGYLHHPGRGNRGISTSRNLGIAHARGEYVAQLDSDDVWLPGHLQHLVQLLNTHRDAALVYGPVERWYSWTGEAADAARDFVARPLDGYDRYLDPPALLPIILQRSYGVPLGFLARREAIQAVGGYEDEFRGMHDDQVFFCKLGLRHRVYVTSECGYRYRRHPDSIVWVTNTEGKKLLHRQRFLSWLEKYLDEQNVRDRRIRAPLKQEIWRSRHPRLAARREQVVDLARRVQRRLRRLRSDYGAAVPGHRQ